MCSINQRRRARAWRDMFADQRWANGVTRPANARAVRRLVSGRLAWFCEAPDEAFWDRHWAQSIQRFSLGPTTPEQLGELASPLRRFLPRSGLVLEAGCGAGGYVAVLRNLGYKVEGVEWGHKTVEAIRLHNPGFPVRVGDVSRLDVPNGHYAGYLSLGVVEHREEGPEPFLREAYRVLALHGVALISVPWFHLLRRVKAYLGCYRGDPTGLGFYQYAFRTWDFEACLKAAGFTVVERFPYDGRKGVKDEIELVRQALAWPRIGWRLNRWLSTSAWVRKRFGHMMLFVCRK